MQDGPTEQEERSVKALTESNVNLRKDLGEKTAKVKELTELNMTQRATIEDLTRDLGEFKRALELLT